MTLTLTLIKGGKAGGPAAGGVAAAFIGGSKPSLL